MLLRFTPRKRLQIPIMTLVSKETLGRKNWIIWLNTYPPECLLFAIAIGDMQINQFSQVHTALKYGFAKTRIQRALSHDPSHKKGGRQYQQERKCKAKPKPQEEESTPAKQAKEQTPIPEAVLQHTEEDELGDLPMDEQGDIIFPEVDV